MLQQKSRLTYFSSFPPSTVHSRGSPIGPQSQDFGLCRRRRRRVSDIPPLLFQPKLEGGGRTKLTLLSFLKTWAVVMWETPREASLVLLPPTELGSEAAIFHKLAPPRHPLTQATKPLGVFTRHLAAPLFKGRKKKRNGGRPTFHPLLLSPSSLPPPPTASNRP